MDTSFPSPDTTTAEKILISATILFARQGYHGASIRSLARMVGVSVATLYYYIQNKEDLYRQVFQRQYEEEYHLIHQIIQEAQEQVVEDPAALRELLFRLMDALIERSQQNPDIVRLWTRRWLEKPAQTEDIETRLSAPLYQMVESLLERARELGTIKPQSASLRLLVHSFTWLHYGYFGFGQLTFGARVSDPFHPNQATEFRQFVHHFFAQTLCFSDQCS